MSALRRPGRPREPVGRDQLLAAARSAFSEFGYAGTSMSVVAQRAGITKATIFHHFPSKELLYAAVIDVVLGELGALVVAADTGRGDHVTRLDALGALVVGYLGEHPGAAGLLLREIGDAGPYYRAGGADAVQATLEVVAAFLQDGMAAGCFAQADPRHLAVSIAALHLMWFAAPEATGALAGVDVFAPEAISARRDAILQQVRALCGVRRPDLKPG